MSLARTSPLDRKRAPHEQHLDEMHDALYALGDQAREPVSSPGGDLLPNGIVPKKPGADKARKHIKKLHGMFKKAKHKE